MMEPRDSHADGAGEAVESCHLSVIVPVYNEQEAVPEFQRRLKVVLDDLRRSSEVVYVDDGSTDGTLALLRDLRKGDPRVAVLSLSRNFGKEIALTAGIDHARGDAVIVIDADLQDPPELIPELIQEWQRGFDVVYATRASRRGESLIRRATAYVFYRVIQRVSRVRIPEDTGDFRLLSRRAVEALRRIREQHRFMKGLFAWIGYPQTAVPYRRDPRIAGRTKWSLWQLWNFALEGITSFTTLPLKVATYFGLTIALAAFCYAVLIVLKTLLRGDPVPGYPSLMVVLLFLGGIQLMFIGIVGEYLGRIFDETKARPLYFVAAFEPSERAAASKAPGTESDLLP
jgi:glycosyltransferase involved in cell wall biosynthesis